MKMPSPDEFPIPWKRALRLTVGGREVAARVRIFKAWWRSELERVAKTTGIRVDNADEMVAFFQANGVDRTWFHTLLIGIAEYQKLKRTERFRNLANRRWSKKSLPSAAKKSCAGRKNAVTHRAQTFHASGFAVGQGVNNTEIAGRTIAPAHTQ